MPQAKDGYTLSSISNSYTFTHTHTWEQAQDLAAHGWPEGAAKAAAHADRLRDALPPVPRPKLGFDVTGQWFDIGRVMEGEPECWANPTPTPERPVKILANLTCSGGVDAEDLLRRGTALVALVALLQERGESVEVWAGVSQQGEPGCECIVRLQEAGTPVSIDTLAYWIGHPSGFRRQFFRAIEKLSPKDTEVWGRGGYGYPVDFTLALDAQPWDCVVQFAGGNQSWRNDDDALAWVARQLKEITVTRNPWETEAEAA